MTLDRSDHQNRSH